MYILLADDHAIVRSGVSRIICDEFPLARIDEVGTFDQLKAKVLNEKEISLLILDISLGDKNGLDIVPDIKNYNPRLPIIILSMYDERQFVLRALSLGVSGYLTKDRAPEELLKAINSVLKGNRYISETIALKIADYVAQIGQKTASPHELLSSREYEVFMLLASAQSVKEIATKLSLSIKTVSTYRGRILEKMNLNSNAEIIQYAFREGIMK